MSGCRVCGGEVREFVDLGRQPLANGFLTRDELDREFFYRLAVGICLSCTMVQLVEEVPRHLRYHDAYPYHTSGTAQMRSHFEEDAQLFLATELAGPDPFFVEIGCNDGALLSPIADAGVRHLGVEPSGTVADMARGKGIRVLGDFFEEGTAEAIRASDGPADVIFGANTICHLAAVESLFAGVDALLRPGGVFVFEEPYLGAILDHTSFDQIYDEHFYFFAVRSVQAMAERFGFELVNVEHLTVHGGEIRYTLARSGQRRPTPEVDEVLAAEKARGLADLETLDRFASAIQHIRYDLVELLTRLRAQGRRVVGYGAPGKSTTLINYCGIGPDLLPFICDSTPSKQGRLAPGSHIPVRPPAEFSARYPDYAVLFAWNYADEIIAKEDGFRAAGGQWILYVPEVHIV